MKKLLFLMLVSMLLIGCDNGYISKKREGMKPYPQEEKSKEAQEARE